MEDMRQRINDLSVLSQTLKKDMNVFNLRVKSLHY